MTFVIPNEYVCPISLELMKDPIICNDGYTYERNSIMNLKNNISPITREILYINNLIPNRALKDAIDRFLLTQKQEILDNNVKLNYNNKEEEFIKKEFELKKEFENARSELILNYHKKKELIKIEFENEHDNLKLNYDNKLKELLKNKDEIRITLEKEQNIISEILKTQSIQQLKVEQSLKKSTQVQKDKRPMW